MDHEMSSLESNPLVVVDVETSGINPFRNDVLAIALVPLLNDAAPFELYVRPKTIQWDSHAKEMFKSYRERWEAGAVNPPMACEGIEHYLASTFSGKRVTPIGHNVGFDVGFLRKLAFLGGRDQLAHLSHRGIDTHTMLYLLYLQGKVPEAALTSDGAFRHFGIRVPEAERHTAIGDALATKQLMLRLLDLFGVNADALIQHAVGA
jgi:DNA polymerase-3 subunit epsilon